MRPSERGRPTVLSPFLHLAARVMKGSRKGRQSEREHVCISSMRTAQAEGITRVDLIGRARGLQNVVQSVFATLCSDPENLSLSLLKHWKSSIPCSWHAMLYFGAGKYKAIVSFIQNENWAPSCVGQSSLIPGN